MEQKKFQEAVAWKNYPRPQLKREGYMILNGEWELNGTSVQVPFPPQSELSGYNKAVEENLLYRKSFMLPKSFTKERVLLHFGAVDQVCEVYLNGVKLYTHEGGYLPFTIDITEVVRRAGESDEENSLEVRVTDTHSEKYPYGKQCKKRGGMWYTPVSGIWQTVWLENVPDEYIRKITITPDLTGAEIKLDFSCNENRPYGLHTVLTEAEAAGSVGAKEIGEPQVETARADRQPMPIMWEMTVLLENGEEIRQLSTEGEDRIDLSGHICVDGTPYRPILWTSENPHLYTVKIRCGEDVVETYFALRTIDIRNILGVNRVCLNGKPIFMHTVLDQGYFPEGIYLPKEEEAYERDILRMKNLGFNMLRKHIKVEPECFYYYCDLHGMLVMQDMVNNGHYSYVPLTVLPTIGLKKRKDVGGIFRWERKSQMEGAVFAGEAKGKNTEDAFGEERKRIFREHTRDTIAHLYNHPCIVAYTIFNEGWGQFDSDSLYEAVKAQDPTRLVDSTSGWFAQKKNDFDSEHIYFRAKNLKPKSRPMFLSECGGFSLPVEGHRFNLGKSYGYGACKSREELTERILEMYRRMVLPAIEKGLCGCVYTQLSDVEDEINGLYTYDREVCKVVEEKFVELAGEIARRIDGKGNQE